jgi:glycine/D-amino acid oxidase-like deaminating enzyme
MVNSERYLGAMFEERLVLVDPARLAREEKRLVCNLGVQVYENTLALDVVYGKDIVIRTPAGMVTCWKVAFTTNAYSHLFIPLRRKQIPAFTYMLATEPLSDDQLAEIVWVGEQGVEDARNLIHYYRITPDKRIVMGGGPVGLTYRNSLDVDSSPPAWRHLEQHIHFLFPHLKGIKVTHRWGGPFSVTLKLLPAIGYLGDERSVYSLGCIVHGVSMSHLNAKVLRDMILERKTDLLDCPFVNRRVIPWPPEPFRIATAFALRTYLQAEDWFYERRLPPSLS